MDDKMDDKKNILNIAIKFNKTKKHFEMILKTYNYDNKKDNEEVIFIDYKTVNQIIKTIGEIKI